MTTLDIFGVAQPDLPVQLSVQAGASLTSYAACPLCTMAFLPTVDSCKVTATCSCVRAFETKSACDVFHLTVASYLYKPVAMLVSPHPQGVTKTCRESYLARAHLRPPAHGNEVCCLKVTRQALTLRLILLAQHPVQGVCLAPAGTGLG